MSRLLLLPTQLALLIVVLLSRGIGVDAMIWFANQWPTVFVPWDNADGGHPGARFLRFGQFLSMGLYTPYTVLPFGVLLLAIAGARTCGRIIGIDISLAGSAFVPLLMLANWFGRRNVYWEVSPYCLIPISVGAVATIVEVCRQRRSLWNDFICCVTTINPISFVLHCVALPRIAGATT